MLQAQINYEGQREDSRSEDGFPIHMITIDEAHFEIAARCKRDALDIAARAYLQ